MVVAASSPYRIPDIPHTSQERNPLIPMMSKSRRYRSAMFGPDKLLLMSEKFFL